MCRRSHLQLSADPAGAAVACVCPPNPVLSHTPSLPSLRALPAQGNRGFTLLPQHPCAFLRNATAAKLAADDSGVYNTNKPVPLR